MSLRSTPLVLLALAACDGTYEITAADVDAGSAGYVSLPLSTASSHDVSSVADPPSKTSPTVAHFEGRRAEGHTAWSFEARRVASALAMDATARAAAEALAAATHGLNDDRRFFVRDGALVVAHSESYDIAWSAGPATRTSHEGDRFSATRPLAVAALPFSHRALLGDTVRVYSLEREVCVATVTGFELEAELDHGPGISWDDDGKEFELKPPAYTGDEVFNQGTPMLIAVLAPLFGECATGVWADVDAGPRPLVYKKGADPDARIKRKAIAAWRATPLYRAIDRRYSEQFSDVWPRPAGRWDDYGGGRPQVETLVAGDDTLVVVSADTWEGCGGPGDRGLAVFRKDGEALRFVTGVAGDTPPHAWLDLEGDGHPEALYQDGHLTRMVRFKVDPSTRSLDLYELTETLDSMYITDLTDHGCGC